MKNYLIVVTADCGDDDLISESYVGTEEDLEIAKKALNLLQFFHDKYVEIHPSSKHNRPGDMIDDLDYCLFLLVDNKETIEDVDFFDFVKAHSDDAYALMDWVNYHWPSINTVISTCHTLESIKAYELQTINPITIYGG